MDAGADGRGQPRSGRNWVFTATTMPLALLMFGAAYLLYSAWQRCTGRYGVPADPFDGPCGTLYGWSSVLSLGFWTVAAVATVVGLVVGLVEGRRRRRFAHGRRAAATVVGLTAPWALLAYTIGYGLGRVAPPPRLTPGQRAAHQAWQTAVDLYRALDAGHPPPTVYAPSFLGDGSVHLDASFGYARFYGMDVTYQPGSTVAIGSPALVAGALIGNLVGAGIGRARAANLARAQWREHCTARVIVTTGATWCLVTGRWLRFDHAAVMEYAVAGDSCVLAFADTEPLHLRGPLAWHHAVLFAYLRRGPGAPGWQHHPFLQPLRASTDSRTAV